jgi:hypothetical protein
VTLSQGRQIWTYPVKMGDTRQTVYNKLGIPETIYGNVEWFPNSGLSIEFDKFGKARLFNFKGNYGWKNWLTSDKKILFGISPKSLLSDCLNNLGEPSAILTDEEKYGWHSYLWRKSGYTIEAQVWIRDYLEGDKTYRKHSIKWLKISPGL